MPWTFVVFYGIVILLAILPIALYLLYLYKDVKTTVPTKFVLLHEIRKYKLIHTTVFFTFIIPFYITLFILWYCQQKSIFVSFDNFIKTISPYLSLVLHLLFTPTTFIAIFGPTILALNYRLFKAHTSDLNKTAPNKYAELYDSGYRQYIDAQFDHSNQLNALIIAWGAFTYQIIMSPLNEIIKLTNSVKILCLKNGYHCLSACLEDKEYGYGDAISSFFIIIEQNKLSMFIILLSFGFVTWIIIRLISGQLSKTDIVELYERDDRQNVTYPPIASRITLYRYILILFSFLYMAWSERYIVSLAMNGLLTTNCDSMKIICEKTDDSMSLPQNPYGIYFVILLICSLLVFLIGRHYIENFKYLISKKPSP